MIESTRDQAIKAIAKRLIAEYGWTDSPGDQPAAYEQAEWAVQALEDEGCIIWTP